MASQIPPRVPGWESSKPFKVDQNMFSNLLTVLDDDSIRDEMLDTHAPNEGDVDVQSLFLLVHKTLGEATAIVDSIVNPKATQGSGSPAFKPTKEGFIPPVAAIHEVACQITCKALDNKNVRETLALLFQELSSYSWVTKAVIVLASFALSYGDFWRLAQIPPSDKLTEPMAVLRGLPAITKFSDVQKIQVYGDLNGIIKTTLNMTECIVEYEHDSKDHPELPQTINIASSIYKIIVCVLTCSIQFTSLITLIDDYKEKDLRVFAGKANQIYYSIKAAFEGYKHQIEEQKECKRLKRLFNAPTDNAELIKALFIIKIDPQPLVKGSEPNKKYQVESLRRKNVMLLISDLNLSHDDLLILENIYKEPVFKEKSYEIVWIPITDQDGEDVIKQVENLQAQMPWYSVCSLKLIYKLAIKIMKDEWHLRQETTVTVLDPQGRVSNQNAMSMIRVWGWGAFPFTDSVDPWKPDVNWIKLLVTDMIVPGIHEAIESEKYILLYGAEDPKVIEGIEEPVTKIKDAGIAIFSHDVNKPLFWSRLRSCMHLKWQTKANVPEALIRAILTIYTNFKMHRGFAVLIKGSQIVTNDSIVNVKEALSKYEAESKGQANVDGKTLDAAITESSKKANGPLECHNFCIPPVVDYIPENVKCPDCPGVMKINLNFQCCHGAH